ncbi:glycoside hydrolase family 9 protein [Acidipila sp. EB88]|uniref:glycoside hydrolase family 9 protein n=1 Tax=Acidipila sp. EB88 TaxID=2305226 RepID=UPI000F60405F|nr:glycoside hydrolase family 9 protein [Acidipila sp. EB88]
MHETSESAGAVMIVPMHRRDVLRTLGMAGVLSQPGMRALASFAPASPTGGTPEALPDQARIFANQLGYRTGDRKQATVRLPGHSAGVPEGASARPEFLVRSISDNAIVLRGRLGAPMDDEASGDRCLVADFSGLQTDGTYRVEVADLHGEPFTIAQRAYRDALRLSMRAFYGQRCGCAVDLGGGYKHASCHHDGAYHPTSGRSGTLPNTGGWHDAGDYGRYIVNSGISTGTLLWAWELYPRAVQSLYLGIPESGGKLPDYLAEVHWNLKWMLSLQDADGGVWHKQTSEHFCAFILPEADKLASYVIGTGSEPFKSTSATADLASVMAIAARCYRPYDASFAAHCLAAARKAWTWASQHPDVPFTNPPSIGTGGYGDPHCGDELAWAAAELWRTTGEAPYEQAFVAALPAELTLGAPGWADVLSMACWTYALSERPGTPAIKSRIHTATQAAAATLVARSSRSGYGNTLAIADYNWGSNSVAANQSLLLLVADRLSPDPDVRAAALGNLHYLLGRNCLDVSWVTQLGTRSFLHPHHRPSAADGIAAPWPGLLSGGPNAHGGDPVADKLPRQPPMRMWIDDERAYSMNEIAINWNAPLVFLLAAANS